MIKIQSDAPINFQPVGEFFDLLERDSSQTKLFEAIRQYLVSQGVTGGYSLGRLGQHEETSLLKIDSYWVVAFTEKGESRFLGIFRSYSEATTFFISHLRHQGDRINWGIVFS